MTEIYFEIMNFFMKWKEYLIFVRKKFRREKTRKKILILPNTGKLLKRQLINVAKERGREIKEKENGRKTFLEGMYKMLTEEENSDAREIGKIKQELNLIYPNSCLMSDTK